MKVLALDYGRARTGVAVSDPTGTVARPVEVVANASTESGLTRLRELVESEQAELVVVGLPVTLRGERGVQAQETELFVEKLRRVVRVPVELYDERFTSVLAGGYDAHAAAHLLSDYLAWSAGREP